MHDGVTSSIVGDLVARIADPVTMSAIIQEITQKRVRDEELPGIVAKAVSMGRCVVQERDLFAMCLANQHQLEVLGDLVTAVLEKGPIANQELIAFLNERAVGRWPVLLQKYNCLSSPEKVFLETVSTIIETASPHDV